MDVLYIMPLYGNVQEVRKSVRKLWIKKEIIQERTGLPLSPYFSAAKIAWILEHVKGAREKAQEGNLCYGTVDSFLIYRLTKGEVYKTDYSNASRTQPF